jgi:hypothetical protein
MFARHKHTSEPTRQEDESLVPHGLVWQAMASADSTETPEAENQNSIPVIRVPEILHPPSALAQDAPSAGPLTAKKPPQNSDLNSPPLFWQKLSRHEAEANASVNSVVDPTPTPPLRAPVATRPKEDPKFVRLARALEQASVKTSARTWERLKKTKPLFALARVRVAGAATFAAARTADAFAQLRVHSQNLNLRAVSLLHSVVIHAKRYVTHGSVPLPSPAVQPSSEEPQVSLPQKVRIRLTGLPLRARLLLVRGIAEWKLMPQTVRPDSPFATLAAIAVLSAVLVLALFSATRHYATASLPSHLSNIASTPIPSAPEPSNIAPLTQPAASSTTAQKITKPARVQKKPPASPPAAPSRRRRIEDDDYVARDTYVYYGNDPARSH